MIDTHCHLNFRDFHGRHEEVMESAARAGVRGAITVSTTSGDCAGNLAIAHAFENVWCSAGVHPLHSDEPIDWDEIRRVAQDPKCVALGELGLDNHYDKPPRDIQDRVLKEQLDKIESWQSEGLNKPIIVHSRKSFDDLIAAFKGRPLDPSRLVFHCFTGTLDDARKVLDFGAWISFTGVVTFKNAGEVAEAAKLVPEDRIMVETDSPFLSPVPVRGMRPNEPKNVAHIGRFIAKLRGVEAGAFGKILDANAERFFGIKIPTPS